MLRNSRDFANRSVDSRIKEWLRPPDASSDLVDAARLRHSDTGRWFFETDHYKWFHSTRGACLWLRGIPGCGKTVLSSTIIRDLRLHSRATGTTTIYFFFSFSDESKQRLEHLLRSLVFQLVGWHSSTGAHLMRLFESSSCGHEQPQTTELVQVFNSMVNGLRDVTVVLDALDESKDRRDLLRWIAATMNEACKFVLTSRSERDIEEFFASWSSPKRSVTLDSDLVGNDIKAYVHYRLEQEEHLSRWRSMHEDIADTLVEKAAGMFRWIYCQLQELAECLDKSAARRMLQTLPTDLNETYDRVLRNIPRSRVPNAIKLLQLLTFSKRPLRLEEVIDAVATDPDAEPPFDAENRVIPPDAIIGYCSNLVKITIASKETFADEKDKEQHGMRSLLIAPWKLSSVNREEEESSMIQLAHFSVRQYLLLGRQENPYHEHFAEKNANAAISHIYLLYLWTIAKLPRAHLWRSYYPLAELAARYWLEHARAAGDSVGFSSSWKSRLFADHDFVRYWLSICRPDWYESPHRLPTAPALYYASLAGLYHMVKEMLETGYGIPSTSSALDDALQAACSSDNLKTVNLLLEYGALVNFGNDRQDNVIYKAAATGDVKLLHLLLSHGAHGDAKNLEIGYPMHAAAENGDLEIIQMLIEYGANVNFRRHNADVDFRRRRGEFVLHIAALSGRTDIVQTLLNSHAIVDIRDEAQRTALHKAAYHGHIKTVKALLKHGANIDAQDFLGHTALHDAHSTGHMHIVNVLLQHGANINACSSMCLEAILQVASDGGHQDIVQMLLTHGVVRSERIKGGLGQIKISA